LRIIFFEKSEKRSKPFLLLYKIKDLLELLISLSK